MVTDKIPVDPADPSWDISRINPIYGCLVKKFTETG